MPMLIKGEEIDKLVERYCAITGLKNKSEAVRQALAAQIEAVSQNVPLADKIRELQAEAAAKGFVSSGSHKADTDDMWSDD